MDEMPKVHTVDIFYTSVYASVIVIVCAYHQPCWPQSLPLLYLIFLCGVRFHVFVCAELQH